MLCAGCLPAVRFTAVAPRSAPAETVSRPLREGLRREIGFVTSTANGNVVPAARITIPRCHAISPASPTAQPRRNIAFVGPVFFACVREDERVPAAGVEPRSEAGSPAPRGCSVLRPRGSTLGIDRNGCPGRVGMLEALAHGPSTLPAAAGARLCAASFRRGVPPQLAEPEGTDEAGAARCVMRACSRTRGQDSGKRHALRRACSRSPHHFVGGRRAGISPAFLARPVAIWGAAIIAPEAGPCCGAIFAIAGNPRAAAALIRALAADAGLAWIVHSICSKSATVSGAHGNRSCALGFRAISRVIDYIRVHLRYRSVPTRRPGRCLVAVRYDRLRAISIPGVAAGDRLRVSGSIRIAACRAGCAVDASVQGETA